MVELETAAERWKYICEHAEISKHPSLTVIHFSDDEELGSIWGTNVSNEANLVMILGSPFAMSDEVTDTFIILDRPGHLLVTHLSYDGGVRVTDWRVPYVFGDRGIISFDVASKQWLTGELRRAADHLTTHRLRGNKYSFIEAFTTAANWGGLHESH